MADYRAYVIDENGHFIKHRGFVCANDTDATVWARQLMDGQDIELWSGPRFVARLSPSQINKHRLLTEKAALHPDQT